MPDESKRLKQSNYSKSFVDSGSESFNICSNLGCLMARISRIAILFRKVGMKETSTGSKNSGVIFSPSTASFLAFCVIRAVLGFQVFSRKTYLMKHSMILENCGRLSSKETTVWPSCCNFFKKSLIALSMAPLMFIS